jgi:hypothetical protein
MVPSKDSTGKGSSTACMARPDRYRGARLVSSGGEDGRTAWHRQNLSRGALNGGERGKGRGTRMAEGEVGGGRVGGGGAKTIRYTHTLLTHMMRGSARVPKLKNWRCGSRDPIPSSKRARALHRYVLSSQRERRAGLHFFLAYSSDATV